MSEELNHSSLKRSGDEKASIESTSSTITDITGGYDFLQQLQPVHFIFCASLPLCIGAFAGYRVEMNRIASGSAESYSPGSTASGGGLLRRVMGEEMRSSFDAVTKNNNSTSKKLSKTAVDAAKAAADTLEMKQVRLDIGRMAFKALGLGSMLSIGGVGLLTAGIFGLSGCGSLEEMLDTWREWTPRKRREMEGMFGIDPKSMKHEDFKATKGMTEDEEWEFIKKKYIPELVDDASNPEDKE